MKAKTFLAACTAALTVVAAVAAPYEIKISDGRPDAMYKLGETCRFTLTARDLATNDVSRGGVVKVKLDNFGARVFATREWDPAAEPVLEMSGTMKEPGFLRVVAMSAPRQAGAIWALGKGNACWSVGFEPERIRPGSARPDDFDAYWDGERARLAREVPPDFRRERVDWLCDGGFEVWKVSCATFGGKRTWGFLVEPKDLSSVRLPLYVNVPGAGPALSEAGTRHYMKPGEIHLVVNVHPYEPAKDGDGQRRLYEAQDRECAKKYGCNYAIAGGAVSREEFFFHDALLGIDRVVAWAASMPEVDRGRVRYSGGSQGGGMGIALCALNPAIGRAVFLVPAMTDLGGFRAGHQSGWPLLVERQKTAAAKSAAEAVAPYFDAAHFAPRVKIPVRVEAGLSDSTCPPPCVYAAYNALGSSDKGIENAIGCGHSGSREIRIRLAAWLREDVSDEERTLAAASDELCRYWRQITGDSRAVPVKLRVDPKISKSGNDAYSIVSTDGTSVQAVISGANARSVLYGVYDLLERRGGCGWFWDGDRVPKKKSIDLSGLDVHEESKFAWRGIRYFAHRGLTRFQAEHWGFAEWKREIDWCIKKRLNLFMLRIGQDDLFQKAFPETCAYPDASKPLPEQGRRYDNRSLFWPLEFRGELRKKVMEYAFRHGMMAPSDFGTMTHWYSRTPQDFLDKMKPAFLPQAPGSYGEPSGLVWDIRDSKWMDAYWRITDVDIREYGRPGLLHTIGIAERSVSTNRTENLVMKTRLTQALLSEAKRRHPESTLLLAGWDLYCMKKPDEVKAFLKKIPEDVVIWDYEADASINTWFGEWDIVGKRPYVFGVFMAYEAGLDARTDYAKIAARQHLVADDPMCKGYILWPESSHVDSVGIEWFAKNAWRADAPDVTPVVADYCERRYPEDARAMSELWMKTIPVSTNMQNVWRWNAFLPILREMGEGLVKEPGRSRWPGAKPKDFFADLPEVVKTLKSLDWDRGEFLRRDMMDVARVWADRLAIDAENAMLCEYFKWLDGDEGAAKRFDALADVACARLDALTSLLALHTDFSVCDSYDRLAKVHPIAYSGFSSVLVDNIANYYCTSHQAELARHCYLPAFRHFAGLLKAKMAAGDRTPVGKGALEEFKDRAMAMPIRALRLDVPRTREAFNRALDAVQSAAGL